MQALRPKLWAPLVLVLGGAGAFAASQGAPVEAADHNDPPNRVHTTAFGTPRAATDDGASDIADVFAWTRDAGGTQHTVLAMSFDGPNPATPTFPLPCDRDVLYQFHISADGGICETMHFVDPDMFACSTPSATHPCGTWDDGAGNTGDCDHPFNDMHTINVRFAHVGSDTSQCYVEAEFVGQDGATAISATPVVGAIETNLTSGSVQLYAGLRDDAFFFDIQGFHDTLTTGTLSFDHTRDGFATRNTPVIVIEFPTSAITHSTHALFAPGDNAVRVWGSTARFHP